MSNQLVAQKLSQQLTAIHIESHRATVENTVKSIWQWLDQPRTLLKGGEAITETFCQVGNAVLKVSSQSLTGDFVYNVARNTVTCSQPLVTVSIVPATEGDLLDALEIVRGSARLRVLEFLRVVRNEPARPLEISIVNAGELHRDKLLVVKRGDDGKMTGAVVQNIPD